MREHVFWYSRNDVQAEPQLHGDIKARAVVTGGGIAGLSCSQWLVENGVEDVVLLEAGLCGSGATGKSSGFITPDSELELHQLERRFGSDDARFLWNAASDACELIRRNIETFNIECDVVEADSLYIANGDSEFATIRDEHRAHQRLGFESQLFTADDLPRIIGSRGFAGGVRYKNDLAIDAFAYVQGLKRKLAERGVRVFENSHVIEAGSNFVKTANGRVSADLVFLCLDRFAPELGVTETQNYHAQTFIAVTEPLSDDVRESLFPEKPLLVWDTDLIYQYFRLTGDGRLLIGGGLLSETYSGDESHGCEKIEHLVAYIREKFPQLGEVKIDSYWPGLIGVTKDLLPLAGRSLHEPSHFYAMCGAGLPWSTLAGRAAAESAVNGESEFERFFAPDRAFNFIEPVQPLIGKPATFALSHYYAKNYQKGSAEDAAWKRDLTLTGLCLAGLAGGFKLAGKIKKAVSRRI